MADCDRPISPSRHCCSDDFRTDISRRSVCCFITVAAIGKYSKRKYFICWIRRYTGCS
nr:unnamed protein product [Callosobruchus chinensis]